MTESSYSYHCDPITPNNFSNIECLLLLRLVYGHAKKRVQMSGIASSFKRSLDIALRIVVSHLA